MKRTGFIMVFLCGMVLVYGIAEFPPWGDPDNPAGKHVSPHYIENTMAETAVPNIVTSVLADYRSYDTMFETTVVFSAAMACFFILRLFGGDEARERLYRHTPTGITFRIKKGGKLPTTGEFERIDTDWVPHDIIVKTTVRLIIPFIQIFALYVIAHGHHSPGGGFQGGVILGASIILFAVSYSLRAAIERSGENRCGALSAAGVSIYAGTGALCMLLGANFLDYSALSGILGTDPIMARSHGILIVEIGVGLAVMSAMVWIYYNITSKGKHDEGL